MYDHNPTYQLYKKVHHWGALPPGTRAERARNIRKNNAAAYADDRRRRRERRGTSYYRQATTIVPTVSVYPSPSTSLLQRTVDRVNQLRHYLGMDPVPDLVPGDCTDANYCPVTRATRIGLDSLAVSTNGRRITVYLGPDEDDRNRRVIMDLPLRGSASFPDRFDVGGYGEYDIDNYDFLRFRTDAY